MHLASRNLSLQIFGEEYLSKLEVGRSIPKVLILQMLSFVLSIDNSANTINTKELETNAR